MGEGIADRVPTGEGRQQGGMGVQDLPGEAVVDRLAEDRAEPSHGYHRHPPVDQELRQAHRVGVPVEVRTEGIPANDDRLDVVVGSQRNGRARTV